MRIYSVETRNEEGIYHRSGDWGVNSERVNIDRLENFTEVQPPEEAFNGVPYDWNGTEWVKDPEYEDALEITKLTIIDRLITAGKINDALTALASDTTAQARWNAAISIKINDPDVTALLTAIGVDPETILY